MFNSALILALMLICSVSSPRTDGLSVRDLYPCPESAEWDDEDPLGPKPSLRYCLFALFTICHQPEKPDAQLVHSLHERYESKGVDVIAVTVLRGSKAKTKINAANLKTPWVSIDWNDTTSMGFPTSEIAMALLIDPSGRVAWSGKLSEAASYLDKTELPMSALPRRGDWPSYAKAVEQRVRQGDLTGALEAVQTLREASKNDAARTQEAETYERTIQQWIEARFAVAEEILSTQRSQVAERFLDQLGKQVRGSAWEQRVRELKKKTKQ